MPNLRIVTKNALRQALSLTASTTAGNLAVSNLPAAVKSAVHRFTGTNGSHRVTWAAPVRIGCVAYPFCNWSPTAQMRVRISDELEATNLLPYSQSFSGNGWAATNVTLTGGVADPAGGSSAFTLTAGSTAARQFSKTLSAGVSALYTGSVWLRRRSGTGVVNLWSAGGVRNTSIATLPATWTRYSVSSATPTTSRSFMIELMASGDKVDIWGAQLEAGAVMTSYYPTTAAAATRPVGYIDSWQSYDYDSGFVLACPAPAVELEGFTLGQAASAYAYGGGAYARHWLPQQLDATGLAVDITDPDNLQGYLEAACMVAGPVWSPQYNASGTSVSVIDRTEISRSAAGDQLVDPGTISRKVPVDLRAMPEVDRARFLDLVRNSRAYPILMSVFPEHAYVALERDFMVYGRRTKDSDIAYQFAGAYSTTLEVEEI